MNRFLTLLMGLTVLSYAWAAPVVAAKNDLTPAKRVAMIIVNTAYKDMRQAGGQARAQKFAATLRDYGFDVSINLNVTRGRMSKIVNRFIGKLTDADLALVYYFGLSAHDSSGSFLVPVDGLFQKSGGSKSKGGAFQVVLSDKGAYQVQTLLNNMKRLSKSSMVILDTFHKVPTGSGSTGGAGSAAFHQLTSASPLTEIRPGLGRLFGSSGKLLVAYNDRPLAVNGRHDGLLTASLLDHLSGKKVKPVRLAALMKEDVYFGTGGLQTPWIDGSLASDMELLRLPSVGKAATAEVRLLLANLDRTLDRNIARNSCQAKQATKRTAKVTTKRRLQLAAAYFGKQNNQKIMSDVSKLQMASLRSIIKFFEKSPACPIFKFNIPAPKPRVVCANGRIKSGRCYCSGNKYRKTLGSNRYTCIRKVARVSKARSSGRTSKRQRIVKKRPALRTRPIYKPTSTSRKSLPNISVPF